MEMFVPAEHAFAAVRDFQEYMASVQGRHDNAVKLFNGVRYVKGVCIIAMATCMRRP